MKKLTFIIASLMLCFVVSMSSCSDKKGSSSDSSSSASASDSTATSGNNGGDNAGGNQQNGPATPEEAFLVIVEEGISNVNNATTMDELEKAYDATTEKVQAWGKNNPDLWQKPTDAILDAQSKYGTAFTEKKNALQNGSTSTSAGDDDDNQGVGNYGYGDHSYGDHNYGNYGEMMEATEMEYDGDEY